MLLTFFNICGLKYVYATYSDVYLYYFLTHAFIFLKGYIKICVLNNAS
jgi:hypothetical protein